jgi:protein involved in plasmid replication-relaxation
MTPHKNIRLSPRDLAIIHDVARFKFLSSFQIHRVHFPQARHSTAADRLTRLTKAAMLSRVFTYPKATGHPTAVYYWTSRNQQQLRAYFGTRALASHWQPFALLATTNHHEKAYSRLYLARELAISEYFLCLEADTSRHRYELVFWERTSPFSAELLAASGMTKKTLTTTVTQDTPHGPVTEPEDVPFNPEAFYVLKSPKQQYLFCFHEDDNSITPPQRFRRKLMGYEAYAQQGRFAQALNYYLKKYQLPSTIDPRTTYFRVTITTPDETRRNTLFLDSLKLPSYRRFLFASMTDVTPTTALSAIWMGGKELALSSEHLKALSRATSPARPSGILVDLREHMPCVSLID